MKKIFLVLSLILISLPAYALVENRSIHTPARDLSLDDGRVIHIPEKRCILPFPSLQDPKGWNVDKQGSCGGQNNNSSLYFISKSVSWLSYILGYSDVLVSVITQPISSVFALDNLTISQIQNLGYVNVYNLQKESVGEDVSFFVYFVERGDSSGHHDFGLMGFRIDHDAQGKSYLVAIALWVGRKSLLESVRGPYMEILKSYQ